ncbi:hypothetical protein D3C71_2221690 [compost metagenome]
MKPSWIACWVSEKAPEITAWLAMMVARIASSTTGIRHVSGIIRKKGSWMMPSRAPISASSTIAPCPI